MSILDKVIKSLRDDFVSVDTARTGIEKKQEINSATKGTDCAVEIGKGYFARNGQIEIFFTAFEQAIILKQNKVRGERIIYNAENGQAGFIWSENPQEFYHVKVADLFTFGGSQPILTQIDLSGTIQEIQDRVTAFKVGKKLTNEEETNQATEKEPPF